jgi:signal transduction histidine kinase
MSTITEFLRKVYFFKDLTDDDIAFLSQYAVIENFGARSIVFREGDPAEKFYVILSGKVEIWKGYDTSEAVKLAEQEPGHIFGEMALVDDLDRSATILTTQPSEFITFNHHDFEHIMKMRTSITLSILRSLSLMVRTSNELVLQNLREQNRQLQKAYHDLKETQNELLRAERFSNMGKFASFILHDLRNPIAVIRGYAEMINLDVEPENPIFDYSKKIMFEADHVTRFANEILDYSRGEIRLNYVMVTIDGLFQKVRSYLQDSFSKKQIQLLFENKCLKPAVLDEERILRALINIADNARKACNAGGSVRFLALCQENDLKISVQDDGEGMSDEVRQKIFEPFYSSSKKGGTGLGMLIVKNVVEAHQGVISVESTEGVGTKITLQLPVQP